MWNTRCPQAEQKSTLDASEEGKMSDNITRDELLKMIWGEPLLFPDTSVLAGMDFMNEIKKRFFEDVFDAIQKGKLVRVVHCRDCVYWEQDKESLADGDCTYHNNQARLYDDYCSFAERRGEE